MLRIPGLKIGSYLLAVLLCAALSTHVGVAQESDSGAQSGNHADSHPDGQGSAAATSDAPANNADAAASGDKKSDDIDTRISVQPHRADKKRDRAEDVKLKLKTKPPFVNAHRRTFPASQHAVRNAVSVPLLQPDVAARPNSARPLAPNAPHIPATAGVVVAVHRPSSNALPSAGSVGAGRSAVGGSGVVHHRIGTPALGGPATTVAGINGTTVRPKH